MYIFYLNWLSPSQKKKHQMDEFSVAFVEVEFEFPRKEHFSSDDNKLTGRINFRQKCYKTIFDITAMATYSFSTKLFRTMSYRNWVVAPDSCANDFANLIPTKILVIAPANTYKFPTVQRSLYLCSAIIASFVLWNAYVMMRAVWQWPYLFIQAGEHLLFILTFLRNSHEFRWLFA